MPYRHFTPVERGQIQAFTKAGQCPAEIARALGRHRSSIGRELKRNSAGSSKEYCPDQAQKRYQERRRDCVRKKRLDHLPLRRYIMEEGSRGWSPEQLAGRLRREYPHDGWMHVAPETIYRTLYQEESLGRILIPHLRQGRKRRRPKGTGKHSRNPFNIPNRVGIEQRPPEVEQRTRLGDWEGDTVIGANRRGAVATLVDRTSLFLCTALLPDRNAQEVARRITKALQALPVPCVKTITFDNGTEFAQHESIARTLGCDIYFAHPYTSNERARNENTNGLLRQYLPKGTSFEILTQEQLDAITYELNNRPRKSLAYQTPYEVFRSALVALAV